MPIAFRQQRVAGSKLLWGEVPAILAPGLISVVLMEPYSHRTILFYFQAVLISRSSLRVTGHIRSPPQTTEVRALTTWRWRTCQRRRVPTQKAVSSQVT